MLSRWIHNIRVLSRAACVNRLSSFGLWLAGLSVVAFLLHEILRGAGIVTSATIGLFAYLGLLGTFVAGLVFVVFGWALVLRQSEMSLPELVRDRVPEQLRKPGTYGSPLLAGILLAVVVNAGLLAGGSARMLHFMDEPAFCGTACHTMAPEWASYPKSPHRNVKCVQCHIGTGVSGLARAKINGTWEMISVTFDLFERPIPVPAHPALPPSNETCQKCHSRTESRGTHIKTFVTHKFDRASTPTYTTVALKLGQGHGKRPTNIHWHTAHPGAVRYQPGDDKLRTVRWVDATSQDGTYKRFTNVKLPKPASTLPKKSMRTMDCIDCHNRPAHQFQNPERAVDEALASGAIDRRIPFIKRVAFKALTGTFRPGWTANHTIDQSVRSYYAWKMPEVSNRKHREIDQAVKVLQGIYARNIHPEMNVSWNTYPDNLGHRGGQGGCFRCHNENMRDRKGVAIRHDCSLCHDLLAYDSKTPFEAFEGTWKGNPQRSMYESFRTQYAKDHNAPVPVYEHKTEIHEHAPSVLSAPSHSATAPSHSSRPVPHKHLPAPSSP